MSTFYLRPESNDIMMLVNASRIFQSQGIHTGKTCTLTGFQDKIWMVTIEQLYTPPRAEPTILVSIPDSTGLVENEVYFLNSGEDVLGVYLKKEMSQKELNPYR
eukprot:TRINITY_DN3252_c0_g1_i1.p1 TRINITY_DN3252_c0_g1~~TRINITY_DN3252_c0_g1_i1.p1  ORF type:complete len:118 (+),score=16.48 TRINITY_DN3252_c0_g1_i1:44-355(+)